MDGIIKKKEKYLEYYFEKNYNSQLWMTCVKKQPKRTFEQYFFNSTFWTFAWIKVCMKQ